MDYKTIILQSSLWSELVSDQRKTKLAREIKENLIDISKGLVEADTISCPNKH